MRLSSKGTVEGRAGWVGREEEEEILGLWPTHRKE